MFFITFLIKNETNSQQTMDQSFCVIFVFCFCFSKITQVNKVFATEIQNVSAQSAGLEEYITYISAEG